MAAARKEISWLYFYVGKSHIKNGGKCTVKVVEVANYLFMLPKSIKKFFLCNTSPHLVYKIQKKSQRQTSRYTSK